MRLAPLWIISSFFAFALAHDIENEVKQEITVIHKSVVKKVPLRTWPDLMNDSIRVIIETNNLKNEKLQEQDLVLWNNGKRMNEKYFNSDHFQRGKKHVYLAGTNCFTAENIYHTLVDRTSMEELLLLLLKSKDLRDLVVGIKTDEHIEAVRQKILELTQKNRNYQIFFEILREHKIVYNILDCENKWRNFVKGNLGNLKKLLEPYYAYARAEDL
eukprot:XP_002260700.1 hypothetical protein, conserved in Plasmodium species [Plasmodium knowlesi strain H]